MGKHGGCDFSELEDFTERINKATKGSLDRFFLDCVNDKAQRFLRRVIRLTPPIGVTKSRGSLKKSWKAKKAVKVAGEYKIEVYNNKPHAKYQEYGFRQPKGLVFLLDKANEIWRRTTGKFVEGFYMMGKTHDEIEAQAPKIYQAKFTKWLNEVLNGKSNN